MKIITDDKFKDSSKYLLIIDSVNCKLSKENFLGQMHKHALGLRSVAN